MRTYSIPDLLYGTYYQPTSYLKKFDGGLINYAEKRDDVWVGDGYEAFAIRYRIDNSITERWATIAVKVSE